MIRVYSPLPFTALYAAAFAALVVLAAPSAMGQVVINELELAGGMSPQGGAQPMIIELYNLGTASVSLSGHTLRSADGIDLVTLPAVLLPADNHLAIVFGAGVNDFDFSDGEGSFYLGAPTLPFDSDDGCGYYPGNPASVTIADYVAWSTSGASVSGSTHSDATSAGIWFDPDFVTFAGESSYANVARVLDGFDTDLPSDWHALEWGALMTTGSGAAASNPNLLEPANGVVLGVGESGLRWSAVPGATHYRLQIDNNADFSSPEFSGDITGTSSNAIAGLADGEYFWRVWPSVGGQLLNKAPESSFLRLWDLTVFDEESANVPGLIPLIQHKDTEMLCIWNHDLGRNDTDARPGCDETAGLNGPWDTGHPAVAAHVPNCEHCSVYCSRASMAMLNRRYGGTLSQDRISYRMFNSERPEPEGDLGHNSGTYPLQRKPAIAWALGLALAQVTLHAGKPTFAALKAEIDAGRPIYIDGFDHATVLHGYTQLKDPTTGAVVKQIVRIANPWPGTPSFFDYTKWEPDSSGWAKAGYFTLPAVAITGRIEEATVGMDSDGDGVVDFDEMPRALECLPNMADSDCDQVEDKSEIRNYVFHDRHHAGHNNDALLFPDIDGDTKRAEADCDSDTHPVAGVDGDFDGGEDIDGDGHNPEAGETCMFDPASFELSVSVDKFVYAIGDPVWLVDIHGGATTHTYHANSVYHYELGAGCPVKVDGTPLNHTGAFTTDAGGHANDVLVTFCTEPGTYYLTVDVLDDNLYSTPDCLDPQTCWICELSCGMTNFCLSNPNSTGSPAQISAVGSCSLALNDLTLIAQPVPNQPGIFFYADNQIQVPFGNGYLCAGGTIERFPVVIASGNAATYTVDLSSTTISAPGAVNFQYWFRDPAGGGTFFNTSDGLEIVFTP